MDTKKRFSSSLATVLTMVGVSVGLGNVWRFPYMMGKFGGSAFLLLYMVFTLLFAIPSLMSELALGREKRSGPLDTFIALFGNNLGVAVGFLLLITVLVADSYYLVVIGNVAYTSYFSVWHGFNDSNQALFQSGLDNGALQFSITFVILLVSLYIIWLGLNKGIEKISKVFVPFFLATILYLIGNALMLDGAVEKLLIFIKPDIDAITIDVTFAALGQAFFSLGLGGTFLLLYGSYMKNDQSIVKTAVLTGFGDIGAALLASLFIIPTLLVFNMDMTSGPRLIFSTLPTLFSQLPGGRILGSLFLISLTMMAFLSNVAALEVFANALTTSKKVNWSKQKVILILGIIEAILILPSALYPDLIGYLDLIFGSGMQTLGSALCVIGLAWFVGKSKASQQIFGNHNSSFSTIYYSWIKWVIPVVLLLILIVYIYESIS
ncbi:MAG: sodium-dependent transporter [Bacteroidota bacterium]